MTKMAPTNFRTYEAQARLLAAVIATTNCKLDFKGEYCFVISHVRMISASAMVPGLHSTFDLYMSPFSILPISLARKSRTMFARGLTRCWPAIAEHIGSEATPSSVDHRLRPMKQLAKLQKQCLREGKDPSMLPIEKGGMASCYNFFPWACHFLRVSQCSQRPC